MNRRWLAALPLTVLLCAPTTSLVIADEGTPVSVNRPTINFTGAGVTCTDNVSSNRTDCSVSSGGGGGAPTTAEYLVGLADATLSAERVVTDTATVTWDLSTASQAKATAIDLSCTACLSATELAADSVGISEITPDPASDDQVLVSDGTSAATWRSVPDCGEAGTLNYTASTNTFSCLTDSGGGGGLSYADAVAAALAGF